VQCAPGCLPATSCPTRVPNPGVCGSQLLQQVATAVDNRRSTASSSRSNPGGHALIWAKPNRGSLFLTCANALSGVALSRPGPEHVGPRFWASGWRATVRGAAGVALFGAALVIGLISFTALTLAGGGPCYEHIAEKVDDDLGGAPTEAEMSWWRLLGRGFATVCCWYYGR
jgi:hypothetical protein